MSTIPTMNYEKLPIQVVIISIWNDDGDSVM